MSFLENRVPPPVVMLAIGLAMWGVSLTSPRPTEIMFRMPLVGFFFVAAALFGAPAIVAFRRAKTTIDPVHVGNASVVVSTGIYGITRNPMYVAMTLLLLSWALYLANVWLLIGPLFFVLFITRFQILPEERAMTARFGATYSKYKARVRRWL
jgi:protein-S-isoprenylcysteine O-methyltransferase Ste14